MLPRDEYLEFIEEVQAYLDHLRAYLFPGFDHDESECRWCTDEMH